MKRKTVLLMLTLFSLTTAMHARILRVNNIAGKAPYSTIAAAVGAAIDGDTIMVEGSTEEYEKTVLSKRIVLIGPGYLLKENGLTAVVSDAVVDGLEVQKEGTVIMGMHIGGWYSLEIKAPKVVVTRCHISSWEGVLFHEGADNCILHQNFLLDNIHSDGKTYSHQITNNICKELGVADISDSFFFYNTLYYGPRPFEFHNASGNLVEGNIVRKKNLEADDKNNTYRDNLGIEDDAMFDGIETDLDLQTRMKGLSGSVTKRYGAFAGDAPYVISGILPGPVIEHVTMPASVEEGDNLKVTIKIAKGQ